MMQTINHVNLFSPFLQIKKTDIPSYKKPPGLNSRAVLRS